LRKKRSLDIRMPPILSKTSSYIGG
jgi:hypothetical protein